MNAALRMMGFRWFEWGKFRWEARFNWAEITGGFGLALALINGGRDSDYEPTWSLHVHLIWPNIYFKVPLPRRRVRGEMFDSWGFSWLAAREDRNTLHLKWGAWSKCVWLPWCPEWVRTSTLLADGTWHHETKVSRLARGGGIDGWRQEREFLDANRWSAEHPYRYVLRSGEVQERVATISVREMEWRPRWLMWLPWAAQVRKSIDVQFSDEVGERTGSWKGGCIGIGHTMLPGETAEQTLRRMEATVKFN